MITSTEAGLLISPEDIASFAGVLGGFKPHWENEVKPKVPGSFDGFVEMVDDFLTRADKVLDNRRQGMVE